jgi:hypothetical protein
LAAPEFQRAVLAGLARYPGLTLHADAPFRIAIERQSADRALTADRAQLAPGSSVRVRLDQFYKAYRHAEMEVPDVIVEVAAAAGVPDTGVELRGPFPLLVRRARMDLPPGTVIRPCPFEPDLAITYARTLPHGDLALGIEEVAARWPQVDDLHALALANLAQATSSTTVEMRGEGDSLSLGYATGDGLDAARVQLPAKLLELASWIPGDALVAVPSRHLLMVISANDEEVVAEAQAHATAMFEAADEPLSGALYRVSPAGEIAGPLR